jgi:hexosaminidase
MNSVVTYGLNRGVRVVIEFDTPGHAASWGVGYPQLTVTDCHSYTHNINNIPLNPTLDSTYQLMHSFFAEISSYFQDNYLHFGGDEVVIYLFSLKLLSFLRYTLPVLTSQVVYGCWGQDSGITAFMQRHGFTYNQLLNYYFSNLWQPLSTWGKTPVVWQEVFLAGVHLPPSTVVHIWQDPSGGVTVEDVVSQGVHGIVSPGWYLDHLDQTWQDMYAIDPLTNCTAGVTSGCFNITNPAEVALVLGGEAAMWGEQVDETNIASRVWPRAAAVAERLWSAARVNDPNAALSRLIAHRCRLVRRGVAAAPLQPGFC